MSERFAQKQCWPDNGNGVYHGPMVTLEQMRRIVAQYCTCGRCIFFETLGGGRCLNAGISEFTTGEEFSPPDEFSCCNWIGREDHTEAT